MCVRKRQTADRWRWCATAIASGSICQDAGSTYYGKRENWPADGRSGPARRAAMWAATWRRIGDSSPARIVALARTPKRGKGELVLRDLAYTCVIPLALGLSLAGVLALP